MKGIVLALDVEKDKAKKLVDRLAGYINYFKVGHKLFTEYPGIINYINKKNKRVVLDLKYHDIPSVVGLAIESVTKKYNPFAITLHTSGGRNMMAAAAEAGDKFSKKARPVLFGVTVLTSLAIGDIKEVFSGLENENVDSVIKNMAKLAKQCRLDGVVCSGNEIKAIKKVCGRGFLTLVPGVSIFEDKRPDQKRKVTLKQAAGYGADYVVIGREIYNSDNPEQLLEGIKV